MATAADYEPELVDALNLLIEDERASVEMEVALASGATEYTERDALARMGAEDIHSCETLRMEMEGAGLPVTPQINGVVFEVLGAERYDDRLRSFAHHQRIVADRAGDLLESNLDGALREALVAIVTAHERHIAWVSARADAFAASRLLEFGPRQSVATAGPESTGPAASETPEAAVPTEPVFDVEMPVIAVDHAAPAATPAEAPLHDEATAPPATVEEAPQPAKPVKRATRATTPRTATPRATKTPTPRKRATPPAKPAPRPRAPRARKPAPPNE